MLMIGLLWPLLGLIGLVGFIWLCVVAFKRHPGWGLLVLFLSPITAIVFAIRHWHESKKPFLIYMGSLAASIALAVYTVSTVGLQMKAMAEEAAAEMSAEMAAQPLGVDVEGQAQAPAQPQAAAAGALDPAEEAELRRAAESMREMNAPQGQEEGATGSAEAAPGAGHDSLAGLTGELPPAGNLSEMVPPGYHLVPVGKAGDYIGKNIRIVARDGKEITGRLADAGPQTLSVERLLSSGTITFELAAGEVETLLVSYQ